MKEFCVYSRPEAVEIRRILAELRLVDRDAQMRLRRMLRDDYEFFISDFTQSKKGFTVTDFDNLIESGKIEIEN